MRKIRIAGDTRAALTMIATRVGEGTSSLDVGDCRPVARLLARADWDVEQPARALEALLRRRHGALDDGARRQAVAALAVSLPGHCPDLALPHSIRDLYAPAFRRLAAGLASSGPYARDDFAKDVRFVLGHTVPAGAQDVDVAWRDDPAGRLGRLKRTTAAAARLTLAGDVDGLAGLLRARPLAPWLQIHTDSRNLEAFNPEGWDSLYLRLADLLAAHPHYAGMVGQSWFYDPAIVGISPRLAYLQERPLANGAVRVRLGASVQDVERATRTSEARRRLHQTGRYRPRSWAIYWPREALLAWARATRVSPSLRMAA